jgi:hypothetical protein
MAQFIVGQQGRATVGVVNDRDLEIRAFGCFGVDQVAGVGDVLDDGRGDPGWQTVLPAATAAP